jgi:activator of HSP90 ATPase
MWLNDSKGEDVANIHQEVLFDAPPAKVCRALADAAEFAKMTGAPAEGSDAEGGAFSAFGGHVTGRHLERMPGQRLVQAWRAKTWPAGAYSVARFELKAEGQKTRLVFDHDGFPEEQKEHLAAGWTANYWDPLRKAL